jgi:predicted phage terminase large subunit-like protein
MKLKDADWIAIERELCKHSLIDFVRLAWPILEPSTPYVHGRHMDVSAEHLQAVTAGQIIRLLINIPPGTMKSMLTGVLWPAWEWGPMGMPSNRIIGASHEVGLATRDALKMRRLVQSEWYQSRWPTMLTGDQNQKTYFENVETGWRQACAVGSMTGRRGDRVIWDDPHSVEDAHSEAALTEANRVFRETLPTRLNSPERSAIIVIMQRLHEKDVSGYIVSQELGYDHLCLPMEYDGRDTKPTSLGFVDWRTKEGELLFPERFPREVVDRDKKVMGEYAVAGQLQQRPAPKGGGVAMVDKIAIVDELPGRLVAIGRGWDLAATEGARDYTASVKMGLLDDGRYIILHAERAQKEVHGRDLMIRRRVEMDGFDVPQSIPQDPGAAGKAQVAAFVKMLAGYDVRFSPETGDKEVRFRGLASQINAGNVLMLRGPWNEPLTDEKRLFPYGSNDDQVDAAARAFTLLLVPDGGIFT